VIRNFGTLEKYLVILLLFLLPTQLAFHFWPSWAFVFGIRVDLLAPALYLTDALILALMLLNLNVLVVFKKYFLIILIFAIVNSVFSTSIAESIYRWVKIVEFSFVGFYFARQKLLKISSIVRILFFSLVVFSLIGILQFVRGGTIGGLLYFLGERSFNLGTPGIALVSLGGVEHLRVYSTFSHPNSLAGFLGAAVLFILLSGKLKRNLLNFVGVSIILICFLLSFSISAYLGIFLVFSFYLFSKNKNNFKWVVVIYLFLSIVGSLLLPLISPWILKMFPLVGQNISQRLDLSYIAGKMVSQKFLVGEGLGTFIVNLPTFKGIFSYSWLLQPVHNIFLLVFSETGILGLLCFCFLVYKTLINQLKTKMLCLLLPLVFILFTGLFDHYTLTIQQNILLFSVFMGLSFHEDGL
jgi:O-antigen ligase